MDLIDRLKAMPEAFSPERYRPLSPDEQASLAAMPQALAERVFAAAMRQAWREYVEPAVGEIERVYNQQRSALRYPE